MVITKFHEMAKQEEIDKKTIDIAKNLLQEGIDKEKIIELDNIN